MTLVGWQAHEVDRVFVYRPNSGAFALHEADGDTMAMYGGPRMLADLTDPTPRPRHSACVFERSGSGWTAHTAYGVRCADNPDALVRYALGLQALEQAVWVGDAASGRGFADPRGCYGIRRAEVEIGLRRTNGELRWLYVGQRVPSGVSPSGHRLHAGQWCMMFVSLVLGADGQPHPVGLWRVG